MSRIQDIKAVIDKLPGDKIRPLSVAIHYLSESEDTPDAGVVGYLKMLEFVIENGLRLVEEENYVRKMLAEDGEAGGGAAAPAGPANSVTGIQPTDEPVIDPATKKNKKNMDSRRAYADLFARK